MGDPAGIGGEITLKAWLQRKSDCIPAFCAVDNVERLRRLAARLGWEVPVVAVDTVADAASRFPQALPVFPVAAPVPDTLGAPDSRSMAAIIESIETAARLAIEGEVVGMVTQPIHKSSLYGKGFAFPGHTEFLGHLTGTEAAPIMMLAGPDLRVVPVTIHQSLVSAIASLSGDRIEDTAIRVAHALTADFGIERPRLALAGLNPHAGEDGALGDEEVRFIRPAADRLRARGLAIAGPLAPDSMFHAKARAGYDAAICMYHDQALIPLKTLAFYEGVNITLGLPIVRTSPDHGTAFDIAGKGVANPASFIAALRQAKAIAACRARS